MTLKYRSKYKPVKNQNVLFPAPGESFCYKQAGHCIGRNLLWIIVCTNGFPLKGYSYLIMWSPLVGVWPLIQSCSPIAYCTGKLQHSWKEGSATAQGKTDGRSSYGILLTDHKWWHILVICCRYPNPWLTLFDSFAYSWVLMFSEWW